MATRKLVFLSANIPADLHRMLQTETVRRDASMQETVDYILKLHFQAAPPKGATHFVSVYHHNDQDFRAREIERWVRLWGKYLAEMPNEKIIVMGLAMSRVLDFTDSVGEQVEKLLGLPPQTISSTEGTGSVGTDGKTAVGLKILGVRIAAALHRKLKAVSVAEKRSIQEVLIVVLRSYFSNPLPPTDWTSRTTFYFWGNSEPEIAQEKAIYNDFLRLCNLSRDVATVFVAAMEHDLQMMKSARWRPESERGRSAKKAGSRSRPKG